MPYLISFSMGKAEFEVGPLVFHGFLFLKSADLGFRDMLRPLKRFR